MSSSELTEEEFRFSHLVTKKDFIKKNTRKQNMTKNTPTYYIGVSLVFPIFLILFFKPVPQIHR